ncbi:MAG: hypothetical protein V1844_24855 [Pseudomonadota bacterium]
MDFQQAANRYQLLWGQLSGGRISPQQFSAEVNQLRVQDPAGCWWQIDPNTGQWLMWNGVQWVAPAAQAQVVAAPAPQTRSVSVKPKPAAPAVWEGLVSVLPGFVIEMLQRWPVYQRDPMLLAGFAVPSLLPALLLPLVPRIGRWTAIMVVLSCLAWLSWPIISQWAEILGNAKFVQNHVGRGLVGVSLLYLIPRIWRAGA